MSKISEFKQSTPSVIAKLMGFDEVSPPPQPPQEPRRVLSENYLRKSDSICLLESQSCRKRRLSKVNYETEPKHTDAFEVQGREKMHRNSIDSVKCGKTRSRIEKGGASHSLSKIGNLRWTNEKNKYEISLPFLSAKKINNQLGEMWKKAKGFEQFVVTRNSTSTIENCGVLDKRETTVKELNHKDETSESSCVSIHNKPKNSSEKDDLFGKAAEDVKMFSENLVERNFELSWSLVGKVEHCSHILDAFSGQEPSALSSFPKIDADFQLSLKEHFSPSPNSVLDPQLNEEMSSSSDSFENIRAAGLQMKLHFLESEMEESDSDGPEMAVSSDGDSWDEPVDYCNDKKNFLLLFRVEESRESSYVVDVLDKASFCGNNIDSKLWYSFDCPLDPSLFEILEKKYGKQSSWDKSERRLLFDRINSGLQEILYPYTQPKLLRKCFHVSRTREVIEDELWQFLVGQDKETNRTLSEKALGTELRWFDLQDDVGIVVCEIEKFLFDKLLAELIYE